MTKSLQSLMTITYPFATEFTNQIRIFFETEREDATADPFSGFKNGYFPPGIPERVPGGES